MPWLSDIFDIYAILVRFLLDDPFTEYVWVEINIFILFLYTVKLGYNKQLVTGWICSLLTGFRCNVV